jgi:hypothetical protein
MRIHVSGEKKGWSVCGLRVVSVKNIVFGGELYAVMMQPDVKDVSMMTMTAMARSQAYP